MKAKLILLGMLATLIVSNTNAQKTSFGVRGGVNFYNVTGKTNNGDKLDNKIRPGYNLGINAEIPIGIDFYVQPGVIYSTKGAKDLFGAEYGIKIGYIEVPVNLLYKPDIGTGKLLLGFGPYVAFGVGGNLIPNSADIKKLPLKFKGEITEDEATTPGHYYIKGFDAGANFFFGYEMSSRFSAQLNAGLGLVNFNAKVKGSDSGKASLNNTGFGVSLGYRFSK